MQHQCCKVFQKAVITKTKCVVASTYWTVVIKDIRNFYGRVKLLEESFGLGPVLEASSNFNESW